MRSISLVIIAFLVLGVAYSIAVPIFEAPDELQHYATTEYIARFKWLPPLGKPTEHLWDQESLQAPLYYIITGALTSWVDTSDFSQQAILQPKTNFGDAELPGKKNSFLHHPLSQSFPYHNTTLAVHIARWFSVLLGAGTIFLTFIIAAFVFLPTTPFPSFPSFLYLPYPLYLPSIFLAFIPQFIFIHSSANNDTMITFTSTLTLAILLWIGRDGITTSETVIARSAVGDEAISKSSSEIASQRTLAMTVWIYRKAILLGVAIGLMCLSKLIGTVLAVAAITLFVSLILLRERKLSAAVAPTLIVLLVAAIIAGWWYVRNQVVYGDPLALNAFLNFVGGNLDIKPVSLNFLDEQFRLLRFSTWGLFGHISLLMTPVWIYSVYDAVALIGAAGFVLGLAQLIIKGNIGDEGNKEEGNRLLALIFNHQSLIIILLWFGTVLVIAARWFFAAGIQGRLIFPGLPAGIVLMVWGIKFLVDRIGGSILSERLYKITTLCVGLQMMIFAGAVIPLYISPAYSPPPLVAESPLKNGGAIFADEIKLNGYTIVRDGDLLKLAFYLETLKTPSHDYTIAIRLVRPDGSFWLDYVNLPGMGTTFPTTWRVGEIRQDEYVFDTRRFPKEEKPLRLIVGFFDSRSKTMTPLTNWNDVREKDWATLKMNNEQ
jgi:hypothetical protein